MSDGKKTPLIIIDPEPRDFLRMDAGLPEGVYEKKELFGFGTRREFRWPAHCVKLSCAEYAKLMETLKVHPDLRDFPEVSLEKSTPGVAVVKISELAGKVGIPDDHYFGRSHSTYNIVMAELAEESGLKLAERNE